uniref:Uncharacterized protein n=1 Tax=Chromera velia CCMP2878 TaxID=1169474 RepID=A0A0G4I7T7_9ALVE
MSSRLFSKNQLALTSAGPFQDEETEAEVVRCTLRKIAPSLSELYKAGEQEPQDRREREKIPFSLSNQSQLRLPSSKVLHGHHHLASPNPPLQAPTAPPTETVGVHRKHKDKRQQKSGGKHAKRAAVDGHRERKTKTSLTEREVGRERGARKPQWNDDTTPATFFDPVLAKTKIFAPKAPHSKEQEDPPAASATASPPRLQTKLKTMTTRDGDTRERPPMRRIEALSPPGRGGVAGREGAGGLRHVSPSDALFEVQKRQRGKGSARRQEARSSASPLRLRRPLVARLHDQQIGFGIQQQQQGGGNGKGGQRRKAGGRETSLSSVSVSVSPQRVGVRGRERSISPGGLRAAAAAQQGREGLPEFSAREEERGRGMDSPRFGVSGGAAADAGSGLERREGETASDLAAFRDRLEDSLTRNFSSTNNRQRGGTIEARLQQETAAKRRAGGASEPSPLPFPPPSGAQMEASDGASLGFLRGPVISVPPPESHSEQSDSSESSCETSDSSSSEETDTEEDGREEEKTRMRDGQTQAALRIEGERDRRQIERKGEEGPRQRGKDRRRLPQHRRRRREREQSASTSSDSDSASSSASEKQRRRGRERHRQRSANVRARKGDRKERQKDREFEAALLADLQQVARQALAESEASDKRVSRLLTENVLASSASKSHNHSPSPPTQSQQRQPAGIPQTRIPQQQQQNSQEETGEGDGWFDPGADAVRPSDHPWCVSSPPYPPEVVREREPMVNRPPSASRANAVPFLSKAQGEKEKVQGSHGDDVAEKEEESPWWRDFMMKRLESRGGGGGGGVCPLV